MDNKEVRICEKVNLSISEAAILFNIGEKKLRSLVKEPNNYTLVVGEKVLIKRRRFEEWLDNQYVL